MPSKGFDCRLSIRRCELVTRYVSAYLFQIAREKSCDYVLITYMKKYEIAYHNCGEAKRAHQVKK